MWFPFQTQCVENKDVKWASFDGRQSSVSIKCSKELQFKTEDAIQVI